MAMIRDATTEDAKRLCEIYNYYVEHTTVTFEEQAISVEQMRGRIAAALEDYAWLVYEADGDVQAYAYGSRWGVRSAYRYSVESTIYVAPSRQGQGVGSRLYRTLLARLRACGYHAVLARLALPNDPSVRLHEKVGFEKVGHIRQAGRKFDKWIDVGYWEVLVGSGD